LLRRLLGPKAPTPGEAMRRLVILKYVAVHALSLPPGVLLPEWRNAWSTEDWTTFVQDLRRQASGLSEQLKREKLWPHLTRDERLLIDSPLLELTDQQRINSSWLMEGAACLLWALHYWDAVPPYDEQATMDLLKSLPPSPVAELQRAANLRRQADIERARDLAELWHWRSRTRQLQEMRGRETSLPPGLTFEKIIGMSAAAARERGDLPAVIGDDFPVFGRPYRDATPDEYATLTSIAMERHRAFNWLCGRAPRNRWDETPTDT
jgi:hypothetical protein